MSQPQLRVATLMPEDALAHAGHQQVFSGRPAWRSWLESDGPGEQPTPQVVRGPTNASSRVSGASSEAGRAQKRLRFGPTFTAAYQPEAPYTALLVQKLANGRGDGWGLNA